MKQEYERIKEALRAATPGTEEYRELLAQAALITTLLSHEAPYSEAGITTTTYVPPEAPVLVAIPEEPQPPFVADLTAESVRDRLKTAAAHGILIQPIIAKFVPEGKPQKFSSVPADKYAELMEELNNA